MNVESDLRADLIGTAHEVADAAQKETLQHFRQTNLSTENKSADDFDPVTIADRAAERAMREVIMRRRPEDGILGEEFGSINGTSGLTWVLDPIDGTRGYISGAPTWGTLIAVGPEDGPILGVVDQPYIGERFIGGLGQAAMIRNGLETPIATRAPRTLETATLYSTFPEVGDAAEKAAFDVLQSQVRLTRFGTDCYAYALMALGQIDLVVEAGLHVYDIQGPMAVVQAAGGIVTNWSGGAAHQGGRVLAAANAEIHAQAIAALNWKE